MEGKQEKAKSVPKEIAPGKVLPDIGKEPLFPDLGNERVTEPETTSTPLEGGQEQQPEPQSRSAQSTLEDGLERSTMQQWLRWLSEQVSGVADQMDEEKCREHLTRSTTQELASLRTQIQEFQGELTKANERVAEMATPSQRAQVVTELV